MKAKKIKAKRYWKTASGTFLHPDKKSAQYFSGFNAAEVAPVVVLPADAASVKAMISQVASSLCAAQRTEGMTMNRAASAVLSAIGIKGGVN